MAEPAAIAERRRGREPTRPPGGPRGPETREAIHAAAIELFARLGYHATSMRAIAAAAGVQPAAIYHWYPSKEAILVQPPGRLHGAADRQGGGRDGARTTARR